MESKSKKMIGGGGGLLLKPCPICNSEIELVHGLSWGRIYPIIQCERCHLKLGLNWVLGSLTKKEAFLKIVEFWGKIAGKYRNDDNKSIIEAEDIVTEKHYINA